MSPAKMSKRIASIKTGYCMSTLKLIPRTMHQSGWTPTSKSYCWQFKILYDILGTYLLITYLYIILIITFKVLFPMSLQNTFNEHFAMRKPEKKLHCFFLHLKLCLSLFVCYLLFYLFCPTFGLATPKSCKNAIIMQKVQKTSYPICN